MKIIKVDISGTEKEEKTQLAKSMQELREMYTEIQGGFRIRTEEDNVFVSEMLKHVKASAAADQARWETVTKPLQQALSAFQALCKPTKDLYKVLEKELKALLGEYALWVRDEQQRALAEVQQATAAGDFEAAHVAGQALRPVSKVEGVSITQKWVVDETQLDLEKVPQEYVLKVLNATAVGEYVKSFGKGRPKDLPGLVFKLEAAVRGSRKG